MVKIPSSTTERLEAFSDGVLAIAITLLVLDLKVPHKEQGDLLHALWRQWPSYAAFFISFIVIGIMRSSQNGTHPHPASRNATCRPGNRSSTPP